MVRKRILAGDYSLKPFPSGGILATELNVNYMTVRRGLDILEKEGVLMRQPNGRMAVKRIQQGDKPHLNLAFISPTFASGTIEYWRLIIERQVASLPCSIKPILFMHWDDPILLDALKGFDGIFLNPIPEAMPESIVKIFRKPEHPIIVIDEDYSSYGVPSVQLFSPVFVQKLLDHLEAQGHTRIGCINTQPSCREVNDRINQWRYWMAAHGLQEHLVDQSVMPHANSADQAYEVMTEILADRSHKETAWFCVTTPAALGTMRALLDHGIQPGKDVAVCTVNGDGIASMLNPPLTALEPVDPTPYVSICLKWLMSGDKKWNGPLLMKPTDVPLVIRESTQPGAGRGAQNSSFIVTRNTMLYPQFYDKEATEQVSSPQ